LCNFISYYGETYGEEFVSRALRRIFGPNTDEMKKKKTENVKFGAS
jgi:hypothetical protein